MLTRGGGWATRSIFQVINGEEERAIYLLGKIIREKEKVLKIPLPWEIGRAKNPRFLCTQKGSAPPPKKKCSKGEERGKR